MTDCLFCKIVAGDIPCKKVYEDDDFLAFYDIAPKAPVHILLVTKKHFDSIADCSAADGDLLGKMLLLCNQLAADAGVGVSGYRLVTNCRKDSGQEVAHLHIHLLGGEKLGDIC